MKKIIRYWLLLFFYTAYMHAQDMHFSQFNEQTSLINPALTGVDNGMKGVISYKNQWKSITTPYTTYGLSLESRLKPGSWQQVDKHRSMTFKERGIGRLAAGLSIFKDKAGDGSLDLTQANLSLATFIPTGKKSLLSVGLQGSFSQRKVDAAAFVFPNQYNGNGYNPGIASNENFQGQSFTYVEVGAGVVWSYKNKLALASHEKTKANIGFSVYHINTPKQKFLILTQDNLYKKYVLYGDFTIEMPNQRTVLAPKLLMQLQGSAFEAVAGLMIKQYLVGGGSKYTGISKSSAIGAGIYYRSKDAIVLNFLLEWKEKYAVGLSYDINLSSLTGTSSGRGGIELMLRCTPPGAFLYQMKKKADTNNNETNPF